MNTINDVYEILDTATFAKATDSDMKRSNANVNADSSMGAMLTYGSETARLWVDDNLLDDDVKQAVEDNILYIHDKDFYGLTFTCCQIELDRLFHGGFDTGHGHIREPNSIATAAALCCIAIQSNQNDMFGGQAIPSFDHYLAPYVKRSYEKNYIKLTELFNELNECEENYARLPQLAWTQTVEQTQQAMEALIHNLNTMNSRAGAQVPFSSINYGTDTTKEGRLVTYCLLEATEKGLGNGETPIFPVQIFKVKEGVNYNPDDPNYDLFRMAMMVSASRLFPNFSFLDAPFNKQYYVEGEFNSEVAYMGCVAPWETITVRDEAGYISHDSFEKLYDRFNGRNVEVWDSNLAGWTRVKTWIKNKDMGNWMHIKLSNGRSLTLTQDHPLPTLRGRVHACDLLIDDQIPTSELTIDLPCFDKPDFSPWLMGMLVCDSSYASNITICVGMDEYDLVREIEAKHEGYVRINEQHRGQEGDYVEVHLHTTDKISSKILKELFGGTKKIDRSLPRSFLMWSRQDRLDLLAGIIDADGYINNKKGCTIQVGSTNKTLALQQLALIESLGCKAKLYENNYCSGKIRYRIEAQAPIDLRLISSKKQNKLNGLRRNGNTVSTHKVVAIEYLGFCDMCSYDVETESDRFDVSGINSHNCRTRVMGNINGPEIAGGRGNISFSSINLVRCALTANTFDEFLNNVNAACEITLKQLLSRYEIQKARHVYNYPFLMGNGVYLDSENLSWCDTVEEALKHGTLSIGFIGLAEAMKSLFGSHHGESEMVYDAAHHTIDRMRTFCDKRTEELGLNITLLATPAEGLSGKFVVKDRKDYGEIEGVTDKEYYTNSFHIPVYYNISVQDKIKKEAPFHALCNAGHITYVELDGDTTNNISAFETIIRYMHDCGIGYGSVNHPVDRDPVCGFRGVIYDTCPCCGRKEFEAVE